MQIASVVDGDTPTILGVPFEPADRPLIDYWRVKLPEDFIDQPITKHWLTFELGGVERGRAALKRLATHVSIEGKVVLDVGAGNGGMCIAAALSGAREVHGIEIRQSRIDLAYQWAACRGVKINIKQGVAESLPFPDSSIDVLILWAVIEHVNDPEQTLDEMKRVLRPGGHAIINAPNRLSPKSFMSDPHYQTMAVSALPHSIAKWWITKVKKVTPEYGVGIFPIYSLFMRSLRKRGFQLVSEDHHQYLLSRLENPDRIRSAMRLPMKALALLGITKVWATLLRNTSQLFVLVVRKQAGG